MTLKEYAILAAINTEGLDNSEWGMSNIPLDTNYYGVKPFFAAKSDKPEELPPHIYIYGIVGKIYCKAMNEVLEKMYDRRYILEDGSFICFYWLERESF